MRILSKRSEGRRKTYPPSPPSCEEGGNRFCPPFPRRKGGRGDRSSVENRNHHQINQQLLKSALARSRQGDFAEDDRALGAGDGRNIPSAAHQRLVGEHRKGERLARVWIDA